MANNLSLYTNLYNAAVLDKVFNKTATLRDFTTQFTDESVSARKSTVKVPLLSGSSVQTNPTTFGGGSNGSTMITVSMDHLSIPFYVSNADYVNGYKMADLVATNAQALVEAIQAVVFAPVTTSNFGIALSAANTAMSLANLQTAWASIKGSNKVCYLDSVAYSKLLTNQTTTVDPQVGSAYAGFSRLAYTDVVTGMGTDIYGFVANPKGLVIATGIPEIAPKAQEMIESTLIDLGNGLTASLNMWGSTSDRSDNASIDIFVGCSVGDPTALKVIKA